jgi:hypothetical protein
VRCETERVVRGTLVVEPEAWLGLFAVDALVALVPAVGALRGKLVG